MVRLAFIKPSSQLIDLLWNSVNLSNFLILSQAISPSIVSITDCQMITVHIAMKQHAKKKNYLHVISVSEFYHSDLHVLETVYYKNLCSINGEDCFTKSKRLRSNGRQKNWRNCQAFFSISFIIIWSFEF